MKHAVRRLSILTFAALAGAGCSSSGMLPSPGSGGTTGTAGSGPGGTGGTGTATGGSTGTAGAGGGFTLVAVCGQRGMATANATSYTGWEEIFMTGDEGLGDDVCVVRLDVKRSGAAPGGCTDCTWSHQVEYTNPKVMIDMNGVCAKSELALDASAIAKMTGTRISIGFAKEYQGAHGSARMKYFDSMMKWDVFGNATWDETTNTFRYDHRDGFCGY